MTKNFFSISGTIFSGSLLISGTCIGGGMLGIPLVTGVAGLFPALLVNTLCWLYMLCTGLLFLEACLWMPQDSNMSSLGQFFLGKWGRYSGSLCFILLYYCLLTAYFAGLAPLVEQSFAFFNITINTTTAHILLVIVSTVVIFAGAKTIDRVNFVLMIGLILSFFLLIGGSVFDINTDLFFHSNWLFFFLSAPILFSAFGYHNIIPSLTTYFKHDVKRLRKIVILGTLIPFVFYSLWQIVILGMIPEATLRDGFEKGMSINQVLRIAHPESWIPQITGFFAFFALITSLLGVSFSTVDFLSDFLKIHKHGLRKLILCLAVFAPPSICASLNPQIFISALSIAGGFGESILNGFFPIVMVWRGRYVMKLQSHQKIISSKILLVLLLAVTLLVFLCEVYELL